MKRWLWISIFALYFFPSRAHAADELVWISGRVTDSDGRSSISGATVVIYDDHNRVADYSSTDSEGRYYLVVPRNVVHLRAGGGEDLLHRVSGIVGGVGRVLTMPLKAGIRAAGSLASAADPVTRVGVGAASSIAQEIVDSLAPPERKNAPTLRARPGAFVARVIAPGRRDAVGIAHIHWVEEQTYSVNGKFRRVYSAWADHAQLVDRSSSEPSKFQTDAFTLLDPLVEPGIAAPGETVNITVKLMAPTDVRSRFVVIARNVLTGDTTEMVPVERDVYRATFSVGSKTPLNDNPYVIVAYPEQPSTPGRSSQAEELLKKNGVFDIRREYIHDPLLTVSRTRPQVVLTVVARKRGGRESSH